MRAMVLPAPHQRLVAERRPVPQPGAGQVLIRVTACAVCRTDLHIVDGELPDPVLPLIPGHEVVGRVAACGPGVQTPPPGTRVGVPWLGWTCGECEYCRSGRENLCLGARFTGYTLDGGYAEWMVADARFCFPLGGELTDTAAAPLLCAGLIGHRCLLRAGPARVLGIYGFGSAAQLVTQLALREGRRVFAFTRTGDTAAQELARRSGAAWAGGSDASPPEPVDAAIIFAPAGDLVPVALRAVKPGGRVVCGGIHMSDIPALPYKLLWQERELCSVANLTRRDGREFLAKAAWAGLRPEVQVFPLEAANEALDALRDGRLHGTAVLLMQP